MSHARAPNVILVAAIVIAVLGMFAVCGSAGALLFFFRGSTPRSVPSVRSENPMRPRVTLRFGGACAPSFEGPITVIPTQNPPSGAVTVSSFVDGQVYGSVSVVGGSGARPRDTTSVRDLERNNVQVSVWDHTRSVGPGWTNWQMPPDALAGSITFQAYEPGAGILHVIFRDVTLPGADGARCTIDGELQTFGPTVGAR